MQNSHNTSSGLIRKTDLAMKYFPDATSPKIARDNLTRWINRCKALSMAMAQTGYRTSDWYYTPRQLALIYHYLGEPG